METVEYKNISFTVWDVGGQTRIRPLWRHYYKDVQGIIFVIDSNDVERLDEAKNEIDQMFNEPELKDAIWLVFANKQVRFWGGHCYLRKTVPNGCVSCYASPFLACCSNTSNSLIFCLVYRTSRRACLPLRLPNA